MHNKTMCACTHTHQERNYIYKEWIELYTHLCLQAHPRIYLEKQKQKRSVFADIITLRISGCDHPGLSNCATNPTISVIRERQREIRDREEEPCEDRGTTWVRSEWCSHKPNNSRSHQKLQDAGRNFPRAFWGNLFLDSNFWAPQPQENKFLLF